MSPRPPPKISLRHDHDWTRGNDELGSTVEQQPIGKLVQQSCGEVQQATFSQLTQPKPKPICDRSGKPENTEDVFVVKGETSRSHEINEKGLHEELGSSDRSGKPDNLSENIRVEQAHDGTGQPVERNSSSAHTVKEQVAPEENRDIASINTDNEFNRAINEENIDFNIPGLPHSAVKQSHGVNVQNLIQKIENHRAFSYRRLSSRTARARVSIPISRFCAEEIGFVYEEVQPRNVRSSRTRRLSAVQRMRTPQPTRRSLPAPESLVWELRQGRQPLH